MHSALSTPLTEALGCDYPVIQTAMGWVATSQLVTASIQAGAFGFLAAAVMDADECEAEIKKIKAITDKPFGVNIHAFQPGVERIVDMCIDYDVAALSYGRGPDPKVVAKVKQAGIKCVPTIGASKHASKAVSMGADILVCQGQEGGGHTGATPTWLLLAEVIDQDLGVPVVACGGFKDGRGLAAALTFGADGIAMGTRFMMSADSPTPKATKAEYLKSNVLQIPVSTKLDGLPQRMILNRTLNDLERSSSLGMLIRALQNGLKYKSQTGMSMAQTIKTAWAMASKTDMTLGQTMMAANAPIIIQRAMVDGCPDDGVLPSGQIAGLINDLPSCADIINKIIIDAEGHLTRVAHRGLTNAD
jgi:NAD(P)H-dependent flavin oxidoreductase YrpB (nitropropane dioxygenase family)